MTDDPIVYLATAPNEPIARMWADVLRDEGIQTMLKPIGPGVGAWASAATFEHELFVLRSRLDQAREVLAAEQNEDDGWIGEGDA